MTLNDIGRMLKLAHVPHSKTVETLYPSPGVVIHVPASHVPIIREVVKRLVLLGQTINVTLLESRDVRPGEHVYVKVKGATHEHINFPDGCAPVEQRRRRREHLRMRNANVVIDCASVVVQ